MSELKTFDSQRIYWAVEQVERVAGDIADLHLDDNLFCIKSEADKLTAELNMRIADSEEDFEIANNQIERLLKIVRYQKYKRCLNMAKWCFTKSNYHYIVGRSEGGRFAKDNFRRSNLYSDWWQRWLKIAEQFKED